MHMGELSSTRQALEGSALAPGSEATLNALRDPLKRPPVPRDPMPRHLAHPEGRVSFNLDETKFARNLRSAKRGAAGGPSRMTVEYLQPLLDHPRDLQRFFRACEQLHLSWQVDRTSAHNVSTTHGQCAERYCPVPARNIN